MSTETDRRRMETLAFNPPIRIRVIERDEVWELRPDGTYTHRGSIVDLSYLWTQGTLRAEATTDAQH